MTRPQPRLILITPTSWPAGKGVAWLEAALSAGDVASLIVTADSPDPAVLEARARRVVVPAQRRDVAVLVHHDSRIAGHVSADGVHIDTGLADLQDAASRLRPQRIVGAGGVGSRHDAMAVGEADPDYIFFGRLDGDSTPEPHPAALDLAAWWAPLFRIPAVLMAGSALDSVVAAAATGVEFVALRNAVWDHPDGPAVAVAEANRLLALEAQAP